MRKRIKNSQIFSNVKLVADDGLIELKSGEVERQVIPLLDLKDTYFIVEDIKSKYDCDYRNRNNKIIEQEEISHYEKFEAEEKEKLKKAIDIVHELLKNTITNFGYKKENNRTYASFTLTKPLEQREQTMIKGRISSNMYHISIDNGNNSKSIIEVHLKNPLEYDFTLEKGNKNV